MKTKFLFLFIALLFLAPARVPAGSIGAGDYTFNEPSANGPVYAVATTSDGHIWMGGWFNSVNGSAHSSENMATLTDTYYCLAVLNTNGTLDADFTFSAYTNLVQYANFLNADYVSAIAVAPSGNQVYVAFSPNYGRSGGEAFIARFDGGSTPGRWTVDPIVTQNTVGHISGVIHSLTVDNFGSIYVAAHVYNHTLPPYTNYDSTLGMFDGYTGLINPQYFLPSGWGAGDTINEIFQVRFVPGYGLLLAGVPGAGNSGANPEPAPLGVSFSCAEQTTCPAGIVTAGELVPYQDGSLVNFERTSLEMERFNGDAPTPLISATNTAANQGYGIARVAALPDGDALIAGEFTKINGYYVNNFAHLLPDGTVDPIFDNNTTFGAVLDMTQEPDGKYLLCGEGTYTAPIFGGVYGWVERRELLPTNHVTFVSQPQPASQTIYEGDNADFYAGVSSWPGLLAQWRKDGSDLAGQTNTSLYLNNVTTGDSGQYSLFVQNEASCYPASAVSSSVKLTVLPTPPAPANDAFANAIGLNGPFVIGAGTIRSATLDPGETDSSGVYAGRSVWWTWTAPFSGTAYVDVSGCDFPAAIGIFTGSAVGSLAVVTNNYDYGINCECIGLLTNFTFDVVAGATYRIAIGGAPNAGSLGDILFKLGQQTVPWERPVSPNTNALYGVTAGNGRIVAVGDNDTIVTSTDGRNWSADAVSSSSSYLNGAAYANGVFIVTGDNGAILTSSDGVDWTQQNSATTNALWGVTFGNGLFVAAGDAGTIVTSPDGIHWTEQTNGIADWFDSVAFNNGQFTAVGAFGEICTSPDGTNWTSQNSGVYDELWGVSAGAGQFVAVGDYGDIVTSPDGTNWTWQDSGLGGDVSLYNVSYGNGHFVAVGDGGALLLSTDGTNWLPDPSGVSNTLYAVSYYENGRFVIVGDNGVILFNQPPRLGVTSRLGQNHIEFDLTGLDGSTAVIEATPTLSPADWQPVETNIISHGVVIFSDVATNRALFYRARLQ